MTTEAKGEAQKTLTVKQAVAKAMAAAKEFYGGQDMVDLTLEEVERSEDGKEWLITLGFFLTKKRPPRGLNELLQGQTHERRYKLFKVDAQTGKVGAMKIRSV